MWLMTVLQNLVESPPRSIKERLPLEYPMMSIMLMYSQTVGHMAHLPEGLEYILRSFLPVQVWKFWNSVHSIKVNRKKKKIFSLTSQLSLLIMPHMLKMYSRKTNKELGCPSDEPGEMAVESLTEISLLPLSFCLIYYPCSPRLFPFSPPPHPTSLLSYSVE